MFKDIIITVVAGLNLGGSATFEEAAITLPQGESVIESNIDWNAMTLFSSNHEVLPKIWYDKQGEWVPWHNFEENGVSQEDSLDLLFAGNLRKNIKIKSEENVNLIAHFFNTKQAQESQTARFDPFDDDTFDNPETGLANKVVVPKFVSRSEWGADEKLRTTASGGIRRYFRRIVPEAGNLPKYLQPKIVSRMDKFGRGLSWPIEENPRIEKFIIHHTGEYVDEKRNPKELMRAIYYFHTMTRGWGDIGYNYVLDKQGNIYEGRFGGPKSVGAHTAYHNVASIGISLMGNFQTEKPTSRQIEVLELLLADHVNRFDIRATGKSFFLGLNSFNISGHRDVARKGHGTACPGKNLHVRLPEIRKRVNYLADQLDKQSRINSRDILSKSKSAPHIAYRNAASKIHGETVFLAAGLGKLIRAQTFQRGDKLYLDLFLKNKTKQTWLKGQKLLVEGIPEGVLISPFRAMEKIKPGRTGLFRAKIWVRNIPNGKYEVTVKPQIKVDVLGRGQGQMYVPDFTYPFYISGDRLAFLKQRKYQGFITQAQKKEQGSLKARILAKNAERRSRQKIKKSNIKAAPKFIQKIDTVSVDVQKKSKSNPIEALVKKTEALEKKVESENVYGPEVKIKLAFFDQKYAIITSEYPIALWDRDKFVQTFPQNSTIRVVSSGSSQALKVLFEEKTFIVNYPIFKGEVLKIKNYDRGLGKIAYNQFRQSLTFVGTSHNSFYVVNTLPLEKYLWGLAEEPSSEPDEKRHAIHVLARSYALTYSGEKRKFKTHHYDLEDDPRSSQYYLGYDWERYHNEQKGLVAHTKGTVITYDGQPVIGPYFTQSSGWSSDKWHHQYPWTRAQKLIHDEGLEPRGHGVGLSGNTARKLAEEGKSYAKILDFFYEGIEIQKVY